MRGVAGKTVNLRGFNGRDWHPAHIDRVTRGLVAVSLAHQEAHEGHAYVAHLEDLSMGNNEYIGIAFTTPATGDLVHIFMSFAAKAATHLEIIESPAVLTGGTPLTAHNRDRECGLTSGVTGLMSYDSTVGGDVITGGTVLTDLYLWTARGIGGEVGEAAEFILAHGTTYAFKLTADAANNAGHIILSWFEHTSEEA